MIGCLLRQRSTICLKIDTCRYQELSGDSEKNNVHNSLRGIIYMCQFLMTRNTDKKSYYCHLVKDSLFTMLMFFVLQVSTLNLLINSNIRR